MGGSPLDRLVMVAACALALTGCASTSYQEAAMEASNNGNQKQATELARKEVARFATADQCSPRTTVNCGTLALAYGTLARYQILDGDRAGGEGSFRSARQALRITDLETRASATAAVYSDVSEAFWKTGDRARAIDVFKEGRSAGADQYLYMTSAARFVDQQQQQEQQQQPEQEPTTSGGNSTAAPGSQQSPPTAPRPNARATTRTAGTGTAGPPLQPATLQPTPLQPSPLQPSPLQPTR